MNPPPAPVSRREIAGWALYDFANSAFATTILAVVFPLYFTRTLGAPEPYWGYCVSAATIVSAVILPVMGAMCDYTAAKKRTLLIFWLIGCAATGGLLWAESWEVAAVLFMVGLVGFEASTAIYNGFLPEIAPGRESTRISSIGWAVGYVGGGLHLVVALLLIKRPSWFALDPESLVPTRAAIASVGIWWFAFSLPMFVWLRERARPRPLPIGRSLVGAGFRKVLSTLAGIRRIPTLARFTLAYFIFSDAVQTVIVMATLFGSRVLGMADQDLILCFLLIQGVGAVGALAFGKVAGRMRDKPALIVCLIVWCGIIAWAFFIRHSWEFWALGVAVGLVMGGTQAIARSLLSRFTPLSSVAEFFGFYAIVGKFAAALGPAAYGLVVQATGSFRMGILSVGVFFAVGLALAIPVNEVRGVQEAEAEERRLAVWAGGGA
ncbi:MAG: MFS transporter [Planctomycetes bacterium]|nr:MFS transporter [Planctomycetota bacterium]